MALVEVLGLIEIMVAAGMVDLGEARAAEEEMAQVD